MSRGIAGIASLTFATLVAASAAAALDIQVNYTDPANYGFNDTTAVAPIGANSGTTRGAQRRNALETAVGIWSSNLVSPVTVVVDASFDELFCDGTSAVVGQGTPKSAAFDFPNAPQPNTYYVAPLVNALVGADVISGSEMFIKFNASVDANCMVGVSYYYGLDFNPGPNGVNFVEIAWHELGHALGFTSLVNATTGAKLNGRDDAFMAHLEDHSTGKMWPDMTNAERVTSAKDGNDLHWVGPYTASSSGAYSSGFSGTHARMYAPNPVEPSSSVSHFSTSFSPNEVMEPAASNASTWEATQGVMADIGWGVAGFPTQTPTPTITATPTVTRTATATQTPTAAPDVDVLTLYKVKPPKKDALGATIDNQVLPEPWVVTVNDTKDPIGAAPENHEVTSATDLALPAGANGAGTLDPNRRWVVYKLKPGSQSYEDPDEKTPKHNQLTVDAWNALGSIRVQTKKVVALLVPTAMDTDVPPAAPVGDDTHFVCYSVNATADGTDQTPLGSNGKGKFRKDLQLFVQDELDDCALDKSGQPTFAGEAAAGTCLADIRKPKWLCNPTTKTAVEPPRTTAAVISTSTPSSNSSLLCYQAKLSSKVLNATSAALSGLNVGDKLSQAKHEKRRARDGSALQVRVGNLFPAPRQLDSGGLRMVCLPTNID